MFDLGGGELLLILVAVLILFGPKKLPELAQGLGKGLRQFKQAQQEFTDQINNAFTEEQRKESARKAQPGATNTVSRPIAPVQQTPPQPETPAGEQKPAQEKQPVTPAPPQNTVQKNEGEA